MSYFRNLVFLLTILGIVPLANAAPLLGSSTDLHFITNLSKKRAVHCYLPDGAKKGTIVVAPRTTEDDAVRLRPFRKILNRLRLRAIDSKRTKQVLKKVRNLKKECRNGELGGEPDNENAIPTTRPTPKPEPTRTPTPIASPTPTPEPERNPVLLPGNGFSGETAQPAAIGESTDPGIEAKAIARWDVVPFQTFGSEPGTEDDTFAIGIVAFHINGIDRVEFSVDGGTWEAVYEMTENPRTGVTEYWVELDAGLFEQDKKVEVRAIAYPTIGIPRVLQNGAGDYGESSLSLFANAGRTLPNTGVEVFISPTGDDATGNGTRDNPFQTIKHTVENTYSSSSGILSGVTISLLPGTYTYPGSISVQGAAVAQPWLTLRAAPGINHSEVILTGPPQNGGVMQKMLHVSGMTLQLPDAGTILSNRSDPFNNHFWIDQCEIIGNGHTGEPVNTGSAVAGGNRPTFYTDIQIHDIVHTDLSSQSLLIRNVTAHNLGADFINSRALIINASVSHMRRANQLVHPDVVQVPLGAIENMIIYGLEARDVVAQGFAIGDASQSFSNVAIVNALMERYINDVEHTWIGGGNAETNHLLYWNVTWVHYTLMFNRDKIRNLGIRNCIIPSISGSGLSGSFPNMDVSNNHFINGNNVLGTNFTIGAPGWMNSEAGDYSPATSSPLRGRVESPSVPIDLFGQKLVTPASIGAIQ